MKVKWPTLILVVLAFFESMYYYPKFPAQVATHWGSNGEVNGYMGKFWGLFLVPVITLVLYLFFMLLPRLDPKKNIPQFKKHFDNFILIFVLFMVYIHTLTIYWNLGHVFDMTIAIIPAMALLFFFLGTLLSNAKPNWFIGIRTPWTLSNDVVWEKTHQLGATLYKVAAIVALFGIIWQKYAIFILIIPIIVVSFYLVAYSYFEYKKVMKK